MCAKPVMQLVAEHYTRKPRRRVGGASPPMEDAR